MLEMIVGNIEGGINIEVSGEIRDMPEFNRDALIDHVNGFLSRQSVAGDISYADIYLKRFEASHLGKPLVFCNVTINTQYGIISEHGSAWGIKQALREAMKNSLDKMEEISEEQMLGSYAEAEALI